MLSPLVHGNLDSAFRLATASVGQRLTVGVSVVVWFLVCSGIGINADATEPAVSPRSRGDVVCGPRCVQYVLQHYGIDSDLIDLVKETQSDFEAGASLATLDDALRRRGVFTAALKLSPNAILQWPQPVLMHLSPETEGMGHFVVWLPTTDGSRSQVWNGLSGTQTGLESVLSKKRSGYVLLTAAAEIRQPETAAQRTIRLELWSLFRLVGVIALIGVVASYWQSVWRACRRVRLSLFGSYLTRKE